MARSGVFDSEQEQCYHIHDGQTWSHCGREPDQDCRSETCSTTDTFSLQKHYAGHVVVTPMLLALEDDHRRSGSPLSTASSKYSSKAISPGCKLETDVVRPSKVHLRPLEKSSSATIFNEATTLNDKDFAEVSSIQVQDFSNHIANSIYLTALQRVHPLPSIPDHSRSKETRYKSFTFYRRLMAIVLIANVAVILSMIARGVRRPGSLNYSEAATAVGANLLVAVLMRQEHVINLLFHLACALPVNAPLKVRRISAKMAYNNGGVHSGSAISALLWYIYYTVLVVQQFEGSNVQSKAVAAISAAILVIFTILILVAHPAIRRQYHDIWELSHRFGGWTAIGLVWAQILTIGFADAHNFGRPVGFALVHLPTFWFLIIITCCLIYPWLRLKRLPINATKLSDHATQLHFTDRHLPTCRGVRLAHNPLVECHGFATIPNAPTNHEDAEKGYSVVISRVGDFTKGMIQTPPKHIWMRGAPTIGVMRLSSLFKPLVVVATGSGIGPCLSFLNVHPDHPMRVIWSARSPEVTYGQEIMRNVLRADSNALIIDTKKTGTPNLVALTYALVHQTQAEAVMIISNPKVTQEVVYGMESRKIAAFGAIFDS